MTLTEAQAELVTIVTAIGEYISGTRRKRFKIMSAGILREYDFSDSEALFKYLTTRRVELESFIASETGTTASIANSFAKNKNIPMVFRKDQ